VVWRDIKMWTMEPVEKRMRVVNIDGGRWLRVGEGEVIEREREWRGGCGLHWRKGDGTNGQNRKKWRRGKTDTTDGRICVRWI
jgi:hypothetical protein